MTALNVRPLIVEARRRALQGAIGGAHAPRVPQDDGFDALPLMQQPRDELADDDYPNSSGNPWAEYILGAVDTSFVCFVDDSVCQLALDVVVVVLPLACILLCDLAGSARLLLLVLCCAGCMMGFFLGFLAFIWFCGNSLSRMQKRGVLAGVMINLLLTISRDGNSSSSGSG